MHATTTQRRRSERAVSPTARTRPVSELLEELAASQAHLAMLAAEVERLKQVCCPWQAYSWHRWPH
jgi:hypothetical protein